MASEETLDLIKRARLGDRAAWNELCAKYYPDWLKGLHGKLGQDLRYICQTEDILLSAIGEALGGIKDLREDSAFFAWVTAIARNKLLAVRRTKRGTRVDLEESTALDTSEPSVRSRMIEEEKSLAVLDAILGLFPRYPSEMSTLYLRYYEGLSIESLEKILGKSDRTVERRLEDALALLGIKLEGLQ